MSFQLESNFMTTDIANLRKEYSKASLDIESANANPFLQFEKWFEEARKGEITEPNAMILSTVDEQQQPFQRTVLMKALDNDGLVFYTNYGSRKAKQISFNAKVSVLFPWYEMERQVAISGYAEKISTQESFKYFTSRPKGSQMGAWVSQQSAVISSRSILEMKLAEMKRKFKEGKIPLPDFWGGYKIKPHSFEFWQGRQNRLHDRLLYENKGEDQNWKIVRLAP